MRGDLVTVEDEIKDPFVLEFLDLRDEYSENNWNCSFKTFTRMR